MITDALEYPLKNNIVDYFVGGFLWSIGIMFIAPLIGLYGYYVKVLENNINNIDYPPKFTDISVKNILIDGISYSTIMAIYWVIGITVIALGVLISVFINELILYLIVLFLSLITIFFVRYMIRASVLIYSDEKIFSKCFSPNKLYSILFSTKFFKTNIVLFLIPIIGFFIGFVLFLIPFIGFLFTMFVIFFLPVVVFYYSVFKLKYISQTYNKI